MIAGDGLPLQKNIVSFSTKSILSVISAETI